MPSIRNLSHSQSGYYLVRGILLIFLLIFILLGLTFLGEANNLDLRFSSEYFTDEKQWFLAKSPPWIWLYEYGVIPGIFLSIISFLTWIFSHTKKKTGNTAPLLINLRFNSNHCLSFAGECSSQRPYRSPASS